MASFAIVGAALRIPAALLVVATIRTLSFRSAPGFSGYMPVRTGTPSFSCTSAQILAQA